MQRNQEYEAAMANAISEAIMKVGKRYGGDTGTIVLLSGEVIFACLQNAAFAAATSKQCQSRAGLREFSDNASKRLMNLVRETQAVLAEGGHPWLTVTHADEAH